MTDSNISPREKTGLPADTWERAYADVLFSHIDRLNDVCDKCDPLERIAQSLRDAFDRVTVVDPVMNRNEAWRAMRADEPWPEPGLTVWFETHDHGRKELRAAQVMLTFRGKDERPWCLLEVDKGYVTLPVLSLRDKLEGPSYLDLALRKPEFARRFLQDAGILDETGKLAPQLRGDEPA